MSPPSPSASSRAYMSSSGCSEWATSSIAGVEVAALGEARGHRRHGEVLGRDLGQLVPGDRRGDRRARLGPDAVGRGDRAVAGVLVVVDEDALAALLLPPLRRHLPGQPPLQLAPEGDRGVTDVGERPARLDADVDVHAAAARRLRVAGEAEVAEQRPRLGRDAHRVLEVGARLRVEVDPQLVRVVDVGRADRPGMEGDRAHLGAQPTTATSVGQTSSAWRPEGNWMRQVST